MTIKRRTWVNIPLLFIALGEPVWADNAVIGAGFALPVPIGVAPGGVVTIFVQGVGSKLREPVVATGTPLPTVLAGISVSLQQSVAPQGPMAVPLFAVFSVRGCASAQLTGCAAFTGITVQIPFEMAVYSAPTLGVRNVVQLVISENGTSGAVVELIPHSDQIHVLRQGDTITMPGTTKTELSASDAIVTHADGSNVTATAPASPGEVLVLWAVGLGQTTPAVASGQATPAPAPSVPAVLAFDFTPNAEPSRPTSTADVLVQSPPSTVATSSPVFSGLAPGSVALYQVNLVVPTAPAGIGPCSGIVRSNLTVSIGRDESFDGAGICVAVKP